MKLHLFLVFFYYLIHSNQDLAGKVSYPDFSRTLQRHRKIHVKDTNIKYTYPSIRAFAEDLQKNPGALKIPRKNGKIDDINIKLVTSSSKSDHLIFYDDKLLQEFEGVINLEGFCDATFKICVFVAGARQIFIVFAKKYLKVKFSYVNLEYIKFFFQISINHCFMVLGSADRMVGYVTKNHKSLRCNMELF